MMLIVTLLFVGILILGVILILFTKNVVHATYGLAIILLVQAAFFILLHSELLAVVQILLYAGGVVVLLIFGVMMTQRKQDKPLSESRNGILPAIVSVACFGFLVTIFHKMEIPNTVVSSSAQIKSIGLSFLTEHLVAFELIAFILLVALVGAAYLSKISTEDGA